MKLRRKRGRWAVPRSTRDAIAARMTVRLQSILRRHRHQGPKLVFRRLRALRVFQCRPRYRMPGSPPPIAEWEPML